MKAKQLFFASHLLAGVVFSAVAPSSSAMAGPKLFAYKGPANSIYINGSIEANANGVDPFTVDLFSLENECLLITVTKQSQLLTATLIARNPHPTYGTHNWLSDGDGHDGFTPQIKAIPGFRGWHSLQVWPFRGATVSADFTIMVSRLDPGDRACAGAN